MQRYAKINEICEEHTTHAPIVRMEEQEEHSLGLNAGPGQLVRAISPLRLAIG